MDGGSSEGSEARFAGYVEARCRMIFQTARRCSATLRDLRDRALIAILTRSVARISAALKMKVEDLRPRGAGCTIRLHEKGGKQHSMPCHRALAEALRA